MIVFLSSVKVNCKNTLSSVVCRGGINREFLAVSFESLGQLEKSHVHLFQLLDSSTVNSGLSELKTPATRKWVGRYCMDVVHFETLQSNRERRERRERQRDGEREKGWRE